MAGFFLFFKRERKRTNLDGKGSREDLGGVEGRKCITRIYPMNILLKDSTALCSGLQSSYKSVITASHFFKGMIGAILKGK